MLSFRARPVDLFAALYTMEQSTAQLGAPASNSIIADALSSLADTLQLSTRDHVVSAQNVAPKASPVDVSGMLESLSAAVPALSQAGTSGAPSNDPASHTLASDGRGPSGGLSGLGHQLLELQQHMQDSHPTEPNSKHRSTAAAIAAALHQAAPQDSEAPDAPDFTLLSETVSESLHNQSHTREPRPRKSPPEPPLTPPMPNPAPTTSMKPSIDVPATRLPPPGPPIEHRLIPAPPPAPPALPPAPPRPQKHPPVGNSQVRPEAGMPATPSAGNFVKGPPSHPHTGSLPPPTSSPLPPLRIYPTDPPVSTHYCGYLCKDVL